MADRPHHISLFVPSLRGGGAERVMVLLANGLAERAHLVDLVLVRAEGPYLTEVSKNVRVVNLDKGRVLASLLPLAQYLRRAQPDAMLSALNHANIIAIVARKLAMVSTRLLVSEHTTPSRSLNEGGGAVVLRLLIKKLYRDADKIVCVSRGIETEMRELFGLPDQKLTAIYNPLDVDAILAKSAEHIEHPWLVDRACPVIVAAGRLTKAKDYPTLLKAFAELRTNRVARLVILGVGEEEVVLKNIARDLNVAAYVDFAGFQANPFAWMARCDLYVLSSAWEGLPGGLMEAMACGSKVVSTDCRNGPREILEGGRWGRLVRVGDAEALSKAMSEALDDSSPPDVRARAEWFRCERAIDQYELHLTGRNEASDA